MLRAKRLAFSISLMLAAVFAVIVWAVSCGGGNGGSVDLAAQAHGPGVQSSAGYDVNYREQTRSSATIQQIDESGAKVANPRGLRGRNFSALPDVRGWILPAAYAADHPVPDDYLVRSGRLDVRVDSVEQAQQKIADIARRHGGSITDSSIRKDDDGHHSGVVTLRVPSAAFFAAWDELRAIGENLIQETASEDVGSEYVAAVSRMNNLLVEQATLQQMLDEALAVQRRRGLGEGYSILLDTQQRLSNVTSEIREIEDRVTALADQITRSTITLNLYENAKNPVVKPAKFEWGLGAVFNESLRDMLAMLRGVAQFAIHFALTAWIWLLPLGLLLWGGWRMLRPKPTAPPVANAAS